MKNIFTFALLINLVACKNFFEIKNSGVAEDTQKSGCTSDNNCVARLAWDSNPLEEEITGYKIEYGEVSRNDASFVSYPYSLQVDGQTSAKLEGLKKKTYYLSIRALSGTEQSDLAPEITIKPEQMKNKIGTPSSTPIEKIQFRK